jgi:CBS domain-containing protein
MQAEQLEILDFLRRHPPFTDLPEQTMHRVAQSVDIRYFKAGTPILAFGDDALAWYVVRSGAVEVFRRDGTLYNQLTEGGYFGEFGLLHRKKVRFPVTALEDTLLYQIPEPLFTELFETCEAFADLVEVEDRSRLRQVVSRREDANQLMAATVESLVSRPAVTLDALATVGQAAQLMTREGVSSLLVTAEPVDQDSASLIGIVTDRDLRTRVLAQGLGYDTPVQHIMTAEPVCVEGHRRVFEALRQMLRHNVHHLPVLKRRLPVSVIALSDIIRYESNNSLFIVSTILRQQSVNDLAALQTDVQNSFVRMVNDETSARIIGSAMALIGRSFKQRLLELAEETLGKPPVPYCFLAMGSMARQEQLLVTDQDNALILHEMFDPEKHDAYFRDLAAFVSDGLARCGYSYCSGGIMATNHKWRQPLRIWQRYFTDWIENPTAQTLLDSNIFFDLDGVYGRTEWADSLRSLIARKAPGNNRFLASMARNALLRTPPLGFFKEFVVESDGRHSRTINLKRRGTAPLTDLIRVHALAIGSKAVNSYERIKDISASGILPPGRGQDLEDALEFISAVRVRTQANDIAQGEPTGNSVEPDKLSAFERKSLRDAFLILDNSQKYLKFRYQSGRNAASGR